MKDSPELPVLFFFFNSSSGGCSGKGRHQKKPTIYCSAAVDQGQGSADRDKAPEDLCCTQGPQLRVDRPNSMRINDVFPSSSLTPASGGAFCNKPSDYPDHHLL